MEPAYRIPLNTEELALLGELTVIMGQIDEIMIHTVGFLLKVDREAANSILGSSKIGDNSAIWAHTIRNRTKDEDILWLVEHADKEIEAVSRERNDFIHAFFTERLAVVRPPDVGNVFFRVDGALQDGPSPIPSPSIFKRLPPMARRVRNPKQRSVEDLSIARDRAARLSCLIAHIAWLIEPNPAAASSWLQRLGPTLPPRLDTVAERKAKAQPAPRPPSQKSQRERRRERRAERARQGNPEKNPQ